MIELLNIFDLPFEVQGIAIYLNKRIVIPTATGYKDVDFERPITAYLRRELENDWKDDGQFDCESKDYEKESTFYLVVIDRHSKYTIQSLIDTLTSQLNNSELAKDISILKDTGDFDKIKTDERYEFTDSQLVKITFKYRYQFINDCNGLICNC